jgi:hypothetical protein
MSTTLYPASLIQIYIISIMLLFSYHMFSFPCTSPLESMANPTTQASSLRYFPYDV